MPASLTKIERRGGRTLWRKSLADGGVTRAMLKAFYAAGIPRPLAEAFRDSFGIPIDWWPTILDVPHEGISWTRRSQKSRVTVNNMNADHRLAISRGQEPEDDFIACLRAAGYTQNGMADELKIPKSLLSMHRRHKKARPVPAQRAQRVQELTVSKKYPKGWPADAKHWPGGLAD